MVRICFVCHGNICRSPMAEFLMKKKVADAGEGADYEIVSRALHTDEIGSGVHRGTARILDRFGIDYSGKRAQLLFAGDYLKYDYFIGMDEYNRRDLLRLFSGDADKKCYNLLDFTDSKRDVADPWYTGDFEKTYSDISFGIEGLKKFLDGQKKNTQK